MDVSSHIYNETIELARTHRRIVHQGGQSAGKTVNILAALATICAQRPVIVTVTSMSFPHLKAGAMRDFERFVMPTFDEAIQQYRKTDHIVLWHSGAILEFKTYESEYDARGARRDILFINEANTFDYMTYWQLDTRSKLSIIDYNPTITFWAHEKVIGEPGTALRISDHRHNPFLDAATHAQTENICVFKRDDKGKICRDEKGKPIVIKGDYELWRVYARGKTGNVKGVIFPDWEIVESIDWTDPFFAIDYGYTNDPTAIIKLEKQGEIMFVEELAYQTGAMTAKKIRDVLEANGCTENSVIYSEHDKDMIKQLQMLELPVSAARKGNDSVKPGIEKMKEYKFKYIGRNLKSELSKYIWAVDKATGKTLNKPIDLNNHAIDAVRYGVYSHYYHDLEEAA